MSRVYWDSMLFIYWLESHPDYAPRVDKLFQASLTRGDEFCTSIFTVGEVLVGPAKMRDAQLAAKIERFFDSGLVTLLPVTRDATRIFADLRARTRTAPVDALHLACASAYGIDLFLTHDKDLLAHQVPGIQFIAGLDARII